MASNPRLLQIQTKKPKRSQKKNVKEKEKDMMNNHHPSSRLEENEQGVKNGDFGLVDIPSFFNKADFFGKLLPGYVAITIYLALFKGDLLLNEPTAPLSFDLFSAVVLIIAGQAIGFTLFVLQRTIYTIQSLLSRNQKKRTIERNS